MEYRSSPAGQTDRIYTVGLLLGGAFFFIFANYTPRFTSLYQFIAVILIGTALYLTIRYRLTFLVFRIEGRNGAFVEDIRISMPEELDFTIGRIKGKMTIPLARFSIAELTSAERVSYDSLSERCAGMTLCKYQADMSPEDGVLLVFCSDEKKIAVFTELPDDMFEFLRRAAENASQDNNF